MAGLLSVSLFIFFFILSTLAFTGLDQSVGKDGVNFSDKYHIDSVSPGVGTNILKGVGGVANVIKTPGIIDSVGRVMQIQDAPTSYEVEMVKKGMKCEKRDSSGLCTSYIENKGFWESTFGDTEETTWFPESSSASNARVPKTAYEQKMLDKGRPCTYVGDDGFCKQY